VVDPGSYLFKCGVAGDDRPRVSVPSVLGSSEKGIRLGRSELARYEQDETVQMKETVVNGKIVHWNSLEALLRYGENGLLGEMAKDDSTLEKRYLFAEGHEMDAAGRERLCELMFEKFGASSMFASNVAPLSLYACARSSGVVLDVGSDLATATVVTDGFIQRDSVQAIPLAGKLLSQTVLSRLEGDRKLVVRPSFTYTKQVKEDGSVVTKPVDAPCHPSFAQYWKLDVADQVVRDLCSVSEKPLKVKKGAKTKEENGQVEDGEEGAPQDAMEVEEQVEKTLPEKGNQVLEENEYMLPDGTIVSDAKTFGREIGDLLLDPSPLGRHDLPCGVAELILKSAAAIQSTESRRDLLANVVLCGGVSTIPGLSSRVAAEVVARMRGFKSRLIMSGLQECTYNAWIGGSILGTLTQLNDMWTSKEDYAEHGPKALSRKCP